jgi:hypothetical protein
VFVRFFKKKRVCWFTGPFDRAKRRSWTLFSLHRPILLPCAERVPARIGCRGGPTGLCGVTPVPVPYRDDVHVRPRRAQGRRRRRSGGDATAQGRAWMNTEITDTGGEPEILL